MLALLRRHGFNTTSFQSLESGLEHWWDESGSACVAYADTGRAWVAAGAPIAAEEDVGAVAERFVAAARAHGRRAVFFATQARLAASGDLVSVPVGLQPVWDPRAWPASLARSASLRYQLQRARNKGVAVRRVDPRELADAGSPVRGEIEALIARWLGTRRMSTMAFLVHVQPFSFAEERRSFVAVHDGRVVGFLSAVPVFARNGWFLEDFIRDARAPNGTTELLVDAAMEQARVEGSTWLTLGLAPLAGDVPAWMRWAGKLGRPLYDFAGLHAFKRKLAPDAWESVFVSHTRDVSTVTAVLDALRAFAGRDLAGFAMRTLLDGPAIVLWVLAVLLVPWTIALALVPVDPWFPSRAVRVAWIAFDAGMVTALFALAWRFRPRLAAVLAVAASADAVLTLVQALAWNAARVRGALEAAMVVTACAAPALASLVLWRSWRRARRASS